ncbi:hypothetical protein ACIOEX_28625 [Streptomyces sp. NPDC087850]|uniref:hypothetical protein n=1 Tax=Streptomyces sp. NPDC087850 TaxID=3365809 RepID=UPI00380FAD0D
MSTTWVPARIAVDNVAAYGPYPAEIDLSHSLRSVYERPRFTAAVVNRLIADHAAANAGMPPELTQAITWDGADIVIVTGTRYGSADPGTERISPDEAGRYQLLSDWCWEVVHPRH